MKMVLKKMLPSKEIRTRNSSAGVGSLGATSRGADATNESTAEISTKGRDEPVVRNLPEVIPWASLLGVSSTETPIQGLASHKKTIKF
jgi:hypothetical protein